MSMASTIFPKRLASLSLSQGSYLEISRPLAVSTKTLKTNRIINNQQNKRHYTVDTAQRNQVKNLKLKSKCLTAFTPVRFNSNSPKQPQDRLTYEEAKEAFESIQKVLNDSKLTEEEKQIEMNKLFVKYRITDLTSDNAILFFGSVTLNKDYSLPEKLMLISKIVQYRIKDEEDGPPVSGGFADQIKRADEMAKVYQNEEWRKKQEEDKKLKEEKSNEENESKEPEQRDEWKKKQSSDKKNQRPPPFTIGIKDGKPVPPGYVSYDIDLGKLLMYISGAGLAYYLLSSESHDREITWQDFRTSLLDKGYVEKLIVVDNRIVKVILNQNGKNQPIHESMVEYYFTIGSVEAFEEKLKKALDENNVPDTLRTPVIYSSSVSVIKTLLRMSPSLLFLFLIWQSRKLFTGGGIGGANGLFGATQKKFKKFNAESNIKINFDDVAGCDEAKEEIMEFVKFLKNPKKYEELGAKIPRGAVLSGPPGTGKTLLAKATAGEAGVPFYSVSGSEFVEMFVGVGASRVRELFKTARENAPSIVFIDEIDAIGKSRSKGKVNGGNDERENTLNQLLVEMDGFQSTDHVVVLAGTNRADVLDQALLRPGRFDRKIYVDNPELEGRKSIFKVHLKKIKLSETTDLEDLVGRLSTLTPGFSGADIANVCNEAALIAVRNDRQSVTLVDFEQAIERVIAGLEKKSKVLSPEEKKVVAFHEAGHAICGWYLEHADPLLKVSIVPRGQGALGYAQYLPADISLYSTRKLLDRMTMTLGGRVSEEMHFKSVTSGASDDFEKATNVAQRMVIECGMSPKLGFINYNQENDNDMTKPFSDKTAALIDSEVHRIIDECYTRCRELLESKRHEVDLVANELLTKEVITREDMVRLLGKRPFANNNDAFDKYLESKEKKDNKNDTNEKANDPEPEASAPTAPST